MIRRRLSEEAGPSSDIPISNSIVTPACSVMAGRGRASHSPPKSFLSSEFLMSRAPEAVTRSEIVEHVWDSNFDSETNLVEVYVNRLRRKVAVEGTRKIIHTVHGVGYCLRTEE